MHNHNESGEEYSFILCSNTACHFTISQINRATPSRLLADPARHHISPVDVGSQTSKLKQRLQSLRDTKGRANGPNECKPESKASLVTPNFDDELDTECDDTYPNTDSSGTSEGRSEPDNDQVVEWSGVESKAVVWSMWLTCSVKWNHKTRSGVVERYTQTAKFLFHKKRMRGIQVVI